MMLNEKLEEIKNRKRIGIMTHAVAGFPNLKLSEEILYSLSKYADIIELQIPFSDPLADGPTIMKACEKSLQNGFKVKDVFDLVSKVSQKIKIPIIFMAYYNTIFVYGIEKFFSDCKSKNVAGLIVPDMPIDEENEEHFLDFSKKYNIPVIRVVAPISSDERLKKNAKVASGFVYCMARQGITGAQKDLSKHLHEYIERVKKYFEIPIAVGFGISKKEHLNVLENICDIAVIGSAIVDVIQKSEGDEVREVGKFLKGLIN